MNPQPKQKSMFERGEDSPLFSGVAQTAVESIFSPQPVEIQDVLPGFGLPPSPVQRAAADDDDPEDYWFEYTQGERAAVMPEEDLTDDNKLF